MTLLDGTNAVLKPEPDGFALIGREALADHAESVLAEVDGVKRGEDPECIHRMRVAIRRFRSVLDSFSGISTVDSSARWNRLLKSTGRRLGAVRDLDVQIEAVKAYLEDLSSPRGPGVERLRLRLCQKRSRLQSRVVKAVEALEAGGVREGVLQELRQDVALARLIGNGAAPESGRDSARPIVVDRMARLLAFDSCVHDAGRETELHDMRIAAKRLRYTMEAFQPLFGKSLKKPLGVVKEMQSLLGEIHDADVWIEFLPRFLRRERERTERYLGHVRGFSRIEADVDRFRENRRRRRTERLLEFRALWTRLCDDGFWQEACRSLETAPVAAPPNVIALPPPDAPVERAA